jgi:hypothetical protein
MLVVADYGSVSMLRWVLLFAVCLPLAPALAANYWQCEDVDAISRGPDALAEIMAGEIDRCRRTNVRGVDTLNCELSRPRAAFGLSAVEVSASIQQGGTRRLSFIFRAGDERVRQAVERRLAVSFEPDIGGYLAISPDDVRRRFRVAPRDDGATQLACEVAGEPERSLMATVEGRLVYPGAAKVPTRVCAIPVDSALPMRCVELPERLKQFRIDGLSAADYYIAAYPLADNPDGVVAAYGRTLRDCTDAPPGCVSTLLVPLRVTAGMTDLGIRIEQRFAAVPERVGRVREGR